MTEPAPRSVGEPDQPPPEASRALRVGGRGGFVGAVLLMATWAVGPGLLTRTCTVTAQLGAALARRAQDLADTALLEGI